MHTSTHFFLSHYQQKKFIMAFFPSLSSFLLLLFFLQLGGIVSGRPVKCSIESIVVTQLKTGNIVEGKPEYEVTVSNSCRCSQAKVLALCYGLSSVEPLDHRAIKPVGDSNCIVNAGKAVVGGSAVKFKYAWMTPQDFPLVSSEIRC